MLQVEAGRTQDFVSDPRCRTLGVENATLIWSPSSTNVLFISALNGTLGFLRVYTGTVIKGRP